MPATTTDAEKKRAEAIGAEHKTKIKQTRLDLTRAVSDVYRFYVEDLRKCLADGLPIEEGPLALDIDALNRGVLRVTKNGVDVNSLTEHC